MHRLMTITICVFFAASLVLLSTGCKTNKGAREFIPGKGWVPVR